MPSLHKRLIPLAFFVFISLIVTFAAAADNPADNACYDGGILENQCQTEADWLCGWHLARAGSLPVGCADYLGAKIYPVGDPRENACYTGGAMEAKCDTDWAWTCGWYLAQWINAGGWAGNYALPDDCFGLLSPASTLPPYPSAGCIPLTSQYYADFNGGWSMPNGTPLYDSPSCTQVYFGVSSQWLVYAPHPYNAAQLCNEAFNLPITSPSLNIDITVCRSPK